MIDRLWAYRRRIFLFIFLIIFVVAIIILAGLIAQQFMRPHPSTISINNATFRIKIADTEEAREKGLSGVTKMADDQALLMVFESEQQWGIWMKDMKIPIDVVWLNKNEQVVYIIENMRPELGTTVSYSPDDPALYVLELPAGSVSRHTIEKGNIARFAIE